ncbi:MAG: pyridoxal phosphate-dependent aminotransferase [Silvanigrellaceae bacterium]
MNRSSPTASVFFRREALEFPKYTLNEPDAPVRLHQNEMLALTPDERGEFLAELARRMESGNAFNTYPSLSPSELIRAFAGTLSVPQDCIEVTAGSSQALTLLAEGLFAPGRKIAITSPSFSLYAHLVRLYGAEPVDIPLDDNFEFSPQALFSDKVMGSQVAIICSPNNPTGTALSHRALLEFADKFSGVIVIDEAYFEFFEARGEISCAGFATKRPNVIVLRTLSKAWSAAGLRVGAMIACPEVISVFRALKPPYSIAWPSEVLATFVLSQKKEETRKKVEQVISMVDDVQALLRGFSGVELLTDSRANFVFFRTNDADALEEVMNRNGFLIRRYTSGRLANCVRISMPPLEMLDSLKNCLREVLQ